MHRLPLGRGVMFEVRPAEGLVATVYPDGVVAGATREDTAENRAEAADQGYTGPDAVWRSLVDHEWAHAVLPPIVFGRDSYVLRHESGAERNRYALRLHEEALIISWQTWARRGDVDGVLLPFLQAICVEELRCRLQSMWAQVSASGCG